MREDKMQNSIGEILCLQRNTHLFIVRIRLDALVLTGEHKNYRA